MLIGSLAGCDTGTPSAEAAEREERAPIEPAASSAPAAQPLKSDMPPLRRVSSWEAPADDRDRGAHRRRRATVADLFEVREVTFPPRVLLLRAFKRERELEVWAAGEAGAPLQMITRYEICAASGLLGPKRREGDRQVPEGFYRIGFFNPKSSYHLSMQVSYPNASDRLLGHPQHPGGEIMIHGACASVGCLAMSDERIEELWVMARSAPLPIEVHVFPARDLAAAAAAEEDAELSAFWTSLEVGKRLFERDQRLPTVRIDEHGRYHFSAAP